MYKLFKHDIIQLQIKPFYIQLPDSLPLNFIAEKPNAKKRFTCPVLHLKTCLFGRSILKSLTHSPEPGGQRFEANCASEGRGNHKETFPKCHAQAF
jgi:hypothetical protein